MTRQLTTEPSQFELRVELGLVNGNKGVSNAGFRIGIQSQLGDDQSALATPVGINAGIDANGKLMIGKKRVPRKLDSNLR